MDYYNTRAFVDATVTTKDRSIEGGESGLDGEIAKDRDVGEAVDDHLKRASTIREEMRFETSVFHDRINALISAEAFLLISFTMALNYASAGLAGKFFWITPVLSIIGFTLAALAWPGVNTGYKILVEWNLLFVDVLNEAHALPTFNWRPSVFVKGDRRIQLDHRRSMLFSRYVPIIFMIAWVVLAGVVLTSPWR